MSRKKVKFLFDLSPDPRAPKNALKITPSKEDRDNAQRLFMQYDEELEDLEILLDDIKENGPKADFLIFHVTAESQINWCEHEIERVKQLRSFYLELM